ncbi:non-ribosomal peptide synthetase [uncultured Phycicoccus sp.]|uniref:non-ribosomal peptide synthetase n=1 Tax=uncultured Phycicoccus sp. TaxID=661422 RepID=UPI00262807FA|nr:non-ribosomal peptide synthetase [uncultured Phycicoccus sp.]
MTLTADTASGTRALPWVAGLGEHGDRVALHTAQGPVTYAELADRVDALAARLAGARRLVHVEGRASHATVVALLAAQAVGHVVLLGAPGVAARALRGAYSPDVVIDADGGVQVLREEPAHVLHPDLALLLSTSGSTGAAKLVRLSADNLVANAEQITDALGVRPDDCAALTLPLTYCYGLSVLTTHLAAGAAVLLTDTTVVDDGFWRAAEAAGVTTLPGVPHTFELLERSGFTDRALPRLRYLTQAGGRMDPARVRRFAELGRRRGFDLVVMYGQSEATARMTTLPPDLAAEHPDTVGVPVPGASIEIDRGEIVFRGPNVMLGYAHEPADLALGRTVHELRTGDLGELTPEGLLRVVGRTARFVKVLGHRIDLEGLERRLQEDGYDVRCAGRDGLVAVAVRALTGAPRLETLRRGVARRCGLPRDAVRVVPVTEFPALENGKPDTAAVLSLAAPGPGKRAPHPGERGVAAIYAELLGVEVRDDSTFTGLGGDSLSYVEVSIRLEALLGRLPGDWHLTPVADLERLRPAPDGADAGEPRTGGRPRRQRWPWRWQTMETSIWLRAVAIVLIVGTHADLFTLQGTANALLVIAGYQLARFQLSGPDRRERSRRVLLAAGRVAAPSLVVIAGAHVVWGLYEPRNLVFANWVFGAEELGPPWRFWFIEAILVALLLVAALTRSGVVERWDRRFPLGLPVALTAAAFLAFRVPWVDLPVPRMHGSALVVLYLFLLGWALARTSTTLQRVLMTGVVVGVIGTFSWNQARDGLTVAVVLLMLWFPVSRVPSVLVPVVRVLAAASLYVYVIHWQALEVLWGHPVAATAGSLALGVAYWWFWTRPVTASWRALTRRRTPPRSPRLSRVTRETRTSPGKCSPA